MSETDGLLLEEFMPRAELVVPEHRIRRARFPAIDAHNHLGRWLSPDWLSSVEDILSVMDACNIRTIVNLDGMWGEQLEANLDRYDRAHPDRFVTFAQADWSRSTEAKFGVMLGDQLRDSVHRGARGLKVWKNLGTQLRDEHGNLIPVDDERLSPLWQAAAESRVPVLIHVADPVAFFRPLDATNERWEELKAHPDWHFCGDQFPSFDAIIEQFEHLIAANPETVFIGAHVGCYSENLGWVDRMLATYPNFNVDIGQRISELGRQPYSSRRLFARHADRILFGTDCFPPSPEWYEPYFRFLETDDEYFNYAAHDELPGQGRWAIYGLDLPDDILRKVYFENAARLLGFTT
ncbi:MAG TPA: amidohydrolase family protein [Chloroflexota bacterium]|nr:amidohydrolase family protein [Chloroflexota bacterium]